MEASTSLDFLATYANHKNKQISQHRENWIYWQEITGFESVKFWADFTWYHRFSHVM